MIASALLFFGVTVLFRGGDWINQVLVPLDNCSLFSCDYLIFNMLENGFEDLLRGLFRGCD